MLNTIALPGGRRLQWEQTAALAMLSIMFNESTKRPALERTPEPSCEMTGMQATTWHTQGLGPILPAYLFNAARCSALAPQGSTVLDLGCGTGHFAAVLAELRPDLKIRGIDLSEDMVEVGNRALENRGLDQRVTLHHGDMTELEGHLSEEVGLICGVFSLHHLPALQDVQRLSRALADARTRTGCAVWIFEADFGKVEHQLAHLFPLYQHFWVPGVQKGEPLRSAGLVPNEASMKARALRLCFGNLPS